MKGLKTQEKVDYELHPADIINEEDLEESMGDPSSIKKKKTGKVRISQENPVKMRSLDVDRSHMKIENEDAYDLKKG